MPDIKSKIQEDMKNAMRSKDKERLSIIRFIIAAIKRDEIDNQTEADDPKVLSILEKLVKQHHDSIAQYQKAGRDELAEKEQFELSVIEDYLPKALDEEKLSSLIQDGIVKVKAASMRDMGKVIQYVKENAQGRIDMQAVSKKIKAILS